MTLNSVEYNENLIIDWTKSELPPERPNVEIGKFIDSLIDHYSDKCEIQPDGHTIYLPLEKGTAKAMSTDEDGNVIWTELEAVTRHPPINEDGTSTLVKITTKSGREVIATKAKSFLIYKNKKIVEKAGKDLNIGDVIPVVNKIRPQKFRETIELKNILDPTKYVFTDYMIEAKKLMDENISNWFKYTKTPYSEQNLIKVINWSLNEKNKKSKLTYVPGFIYPKQWRSFNKKVNKFPSSIKLDRNFGFLIGAYLAEGCTTRF